MRFQETLTYKKVISAWVRVAAKPRPMSYGDGKLIKIFNEASNNRGNV